MADVGVNVIVGAQQTFTAGEVIPAGYWAVISPTFGVKIPPSNNVITYVTGEWMQSDGTWTSATAGQIAAPLASGQPAPIQPAPVPPSAPGVAQPVFKSGSATVPATPIVTTGNPIVPPPTIGNPVSVPVFPPVSPNTAPVSVPLGPLVGPAVGGNLVGPPPPPYPPTFKTGSATSPTAASWFPQFTTTFPSPTVVFANIFNLWPTAVPMTMTTQNVR